MSTGSISAGRFMGQRVPRKEDARLLTGRGTYTDDIQLPGMLHAAFVRSHVARGTIAKLDTSAALALDGVVAVFTGDDLNDGVGSMQPTMMLEAGGPPLKPLTVGEVRFVGDPVAIVVAETRYLAEDAVDLVELEIDPLPPIVDPEASATDSDLVHPELGTNVNALAEVPPDPEWEELLAGAAHVVKARLTQARQTPVPMEARSVVARFDPASPQLDIWMATQSPHDQRAVFSRLTGVPEHHVRVQAKDVGGGFGQKMFTQREEQIAILAAVKLHRPVKWTEDRRENLMASTHARADIIDCTVALDAEGRILGSYVDLLEDCGAWPVGANGGAGGAAAAQFPGPYRIPKHAFRSRSVWTNTCARGAYRGPWLLETVAREEMLDIVAREIGMDPLELRRKNVIRQEELPYPSPMGYPYDVMTCDLTLEQAAEAIDYESFRKEQQRALEEGRLLGLGIGLYAEPTAMPFGALSVGIATVRVHQTGKVHVSVGSGDHGQGTETTIAQIVAEELGVDYDDVVVLQGDTDVAPFGAGTGGSRTAVVYGNAARQAALEVREKVLRIAAHLMEAAAEDLEMEGSRISVRGTPARAMTLAEVALTAHNNTMALPPDVTPGLETVAQYDAPLAWSNACQMCTVEVDRATGQVNILRYLVSEDCGTMINPMIVEGQVAGGVAQGIAGVLYEHLVYDDDGNPLTTTFMDYLVPTASEIPDIEYFHIETKANSPNGAKGVGEGGAIGAPPCVFNAVADALALVGARVYDQPLTPDRVLAALTAAAASQ